MISNTNAIDPAEAINHITSGRRRAMLCEL
jgi:hypothetical protein